MSRTGGVDSFRQAGHVTIWRNQGRSILSPLNHGGLNWKGIILRCSLCSFVSRHPSSVLKTLIDLESRITRALHKKSRKPSSLCNLCVLCVSLVDEFREKTHHRDTENTEVAQRNPYVRTFCPKPLTRDGDSDDPVQDVAMLLLKRVTYSDARKIECIS